MTTGTAGGNVSIDELELGGYNVANELSQGSVGEVLVFNSVLTPAQLAEEQAYLQAKWMGVGVYGNGQLASASPLIINSGATVDLNGSPQQVGALSDYTRGNGGAVINSNTIAASLAFATPASSTFSGTIGVAASSVGAISVTMNGAGVQTLVAANAYTGGTTVSSGTLVAANNSALGNGPLSVNGQMNFVTANPNAVTALSGSGTVVLGNTSPAVNTTLTVNSLNNSTFNGTIGQAASATGSLVKQGAGNLTLGGSSTYSGGTNINAGTVTSTSPYALGTGNINLNSGTLAVSGGAAGVVETVIDHGGYVGLGTNATNGYSAVYLSPRAGYIYGNDGNPGVNYVQPGTFPNATTPWSDNRTIVYDGLFNFQPTAGNTTHALTFAWSIDDQANVYIKNDAGTWIDMATGQPFNPNNVQAPWDPGTAPTITGLSPGYHQIEIRFYNGGGGFGPSGNGAISNGLNSFGFGYDETGNLVGARPGFNFGYTAGSDFLPMIDSGNGNMLINGPVGGLSYQSVPQRDRSLQFGCRPPGQFRRP